MCGIAGTIVFNNQSFKITPEYLVLMRDTMFHRGPDGGDIWIDESTQVGFAHRRLSIIDPSTSATQPMLTPDGKYCITFNGEIYNHADIRQELITLGDTTWKTDHSDTEVILHAFAQWGIEAIHRFRGMFAFAIWDNVKKEAWLVRDRIGVKPLYYSVHHGRLVFASEIKALLKDPDQDRAVNEEALYHYLSFLTTPAPNTLFAGIKKLSPGTWLKVTLDGNIQEHRYWDVLDHTKPVTNASEDKIAATVLSKLRDAVKIRKVSDVPIGIFLSGGIDSSTNAALFAEGETNPIKTFSIGYQGEYKSYQNELHYAQLMAQKIGAEHHERLLTQDDLIDFLPRMIELQDEPIADPVCVPVYYVSKLARDNGVIVCQVGEGADELFWGYPTWKLKLQLQKLANIPGTGFIQKAVKGILSKLGKDQSHEFEALRRSTNKQPVFWGGAEAFTETQKQSILSPALRERFKGYTSWEAIKPIWNRYQEKCWEKSILHWMTYLDLNMRLPELLLMRVDKMSMGVSLEGRVPFLDHQFVEYAMSIPTKIKTKDNNLKSILKKAVRGIIPDELIDRKKQGFGVPVYEWFLDRLGDNMKATLRQFCKEAPYLDINGVEQLFETKQSSQIWYLYNLALWWNTHIKDHAKSN